MPQFRSGFTGTALINTNELAVVGWNVPTADATIVEFVNSLTGNHPVLGVTISVANFSIEYDWSDTVNPFGAPLNIYPGLFITNTKLYLDGNVGSLFWNFPSAVVRSTPQSTTRLGKIIGRIECRASGQWAPPGGSLQ